MSDASHNQRTGLTRAVELAIYAPIGVGMYLRDVGPMLINMFVARGRAELDRHQETVQQRVTSAKSFGEVTVAFGLPMLRQQLEKTVGVLRRDDADDDDTEAAATEGSEPMPVPEPLRAVAPLADDRDDDRDRAAPAATTTGDANVAGGAPSIVFQKVSLYDPPASDELPIPGYDALSASQVVERLQGLPPTELDAVYAYESAHRQRRTILGKIEQLAG